jgi:hypothetical protein
MLSNLSDTDDFATSAVDTLDLGRHPMLLLFTLFMRTFATFTTNNSLEIAFNFKLEFNITAHFIDRAAV